MKVLAIDPAFRNIGWTLWENDKIIDCGSIQTKASKNKKKYVYEQDYIDIINVKSMIDELFKKTSPNIIFCEAMGGSQNSKSAKLMGYVFCIISVTAYQFNIPIEFITERNAKKGYTGLVSITKQEMMEKVKKDYPYFEFPKQKNRFEHIADSVAVYVSQKKISNLYKFINNGG